MNKVIFITAIIIASANALTPKPKTTTTRGCFQWNQFVKSCSVCYRRSFNGDRCGPLLPSTDPCLIPEEQIDRAPLCRLCKPGYGLTKEQACAPLNIFGCVRGLITEQGQKCLACAGGQYPNDEGTECIVASPSNSISDCLWGGANGTCYKCFPGYVLSFNGKFCFSQSSSQKGCYQLARGGSDCYVCNAWNGYSMQKDGTCQFINQ